MKELLDWCAAQRCVIDKVSSASRLTLQPVAGDASFRRYFRLSDGANSWVVMDAPPDREDCGPFLDVAERLLEAGVHAPAVWAKDLSRGWLLLEDLGDDLYRGLIDQGGVEECFRNAFTALQKMAVDVNAEGLPRFDQKLLQQELDLLPHWFVQHHLHDSFDAPEQELWQSLCGLLIASAAEQPQVFVHRDFHSCNLLATEVNSPGVIDFQDAVLGPITYDLVSLVWDRYISWPREKLEEWMEHFRLQLGLEIDPLTWQRWCDYMGLQRNLKVVGIFARLYYRDGKQGYLEMMPRFKSYVLDVIARYEELAPYRGLLERILCAR
jgi:aminoglycoside/choline kinase family phosphotransferase